MYTDTNSHATQSEVCFFILLLLYSWYYKQTFCSNKNQDTETNADSNFKCGPKRSHVNFFGSEGVLKAQAEPFPVLLSRALFSAVPPRATAAAAAAAARLARRTRIRFGETPRKPADIAEWNLGSSFTEPVFCFWVKEFKVGTLLFRVCVSVSLLPQPPPPPPLVGPPNSHVATPPTTCCCPYLCPCPTPPCRSSSCPSRPASSFQPPQHSALKRAWPQLSLTFHFQTTLHVQVLRASSLHPAPARAPRFLVSRP